MKMKKRNFAIKLGVTLVSTLGLGAMALANSNQANAIVINSDQANSNTRRIKVTLKLGQQEMTADLNVEKAKNGIFLGSSVLNALRDKGFRGATIDSIDQQKGTCSVNLVQWKSNERLFDKLGSLVIKVPNKIYAAQPVDRPSKPIRELDVQIETQNKETKKTYVLGELLGVDGGAYVFKLKNDSTKLARIPKEDANGLQDDLGTAKQPGLIQMVEPGVITGGRKFNYQNVDVEITKDTPVQIVENYELDTLLGEGGESYIFTLKGHTDKVVRVPKEDDEAIFGSRDDSKELQGFLETKTYPGLVKMFGTGEITTEYSFNDKNSIKTTIKPETQCQIMEKCEGELSNALANKGLPEQITIIEDVLQGIQNLEVLGYIHHDIKGANILLKRDGHACLTDFGIARKIGSPRDETGTLTHMAPESIGDGKDVTDKQAVGQDIYSLGMAMIFSLSKSEKLSDDFCQAIDADKVRLQFAVCKRSKSYIDAKNSLYQTLSNGGVNPALLKLLKAMTNAYIDQRPTIDQCLNALREIKANENIDPESLALPLQTEEARVAKVAEEARLAKKKADHEREQRAKPITFGKPVTKAISIPVAKDTSAKKPTTAGKTTSVPVAKVDKSERYQDVTLGIEVQKITGKNVWFSVIRDGEEVTGEKIPKKSILPFNDANTFNTLLISKIIGVIKIAVPDVTGIIVKNYGENGNTLPGGPVEDLQTDDGTVIPALQRPLSSLTVGVDTIISFVTATKQN